MARKWFSFLRSVHSLKRTTGLHLIRHSLVVFLLGLFLAVGVTPVFSQVSVTTQITQSVVNAEQLVNVAQEAYEVGQYNDAIQSLNGAIEVFRMGGETSHQSLAITLTNLGNVQLALGQPEMALVTWEESRKIFNELQDQSGVIRSQVYQTRALRDLGLNLRACEVFGEAVLDINGLKCEYLAREKPRSQIIAALRNEPSPVSAIGLHTLGDILRAVGELDASYDVLSSALDNLKAGDITYSLQAEANIRLSLANTLRAKGNLERDRQASPVYDYVPWGYVKSEGFSASDNCGDIDDLSCYAAATREYQNAIGVIETTSQNLTLPSSILKLQIKLNLLRFYIEQGNTFDAINLWEKSLKTIEIERLPSNRTTIYASINLAKSLAYLKELESKDSANHDLPSWKVIEATLEKAFDDAQNLSYEDNLAQSYALGNLAGLYEYCGSREEEQTCNLTLSYNSLIQKSKELTQTALVLAQPDENPDIAYQWQWQLGRLEEAQNNSKVAIDYYSNAIETLESVRSNLLVVNSDVQFSFRDNIEPLYRGGVNLLLQPGKYQDLEKARRLIDNLQLAELENFLQCNWQSNERIPLDQLVEADNSSAVIYPILLENRLDVIVKTPHSIALYSHEDVNKNEVENTVGELRQLLVKRRPSLKRLHKLSNKLYAWLIRDAEKNNAWDPGKTKTLIFVLDGPFRDIPMSTLYDIDSESYLIEKYAVSLSVGLELPVLNQKSQLKALVTGQSQDTGFSGFNALGGVDAELGIIKNVLQGSDNVDYLEITSQSLNRDSLFDAAAASNYDIIHLATHGKFSSDPEDTFIIPAPGQKIFLSELDDLFQSNPQNVVQLLVLSACQTATGDKRAILGLSGVTIQSGVRSSVGTLWSVDDIATAVFMKLFYENIGKSSGIAEALQQAQISFLRGGEEGYENYRRYRDSRFWAPYMIVGNWQKVIEF
ncbi:CHAT domain-containing protein [Leptolyngbya cf. ectocarpi LEGE 11479]|uniref:CHAT domain-containing protein n=1 Tax=Leptolyngbya cf. ectocarpi LEGE 11479 TaxID=1828722 RepID=A0A929F9Q2_LEPEC|nr:CHAT domain-containing protein [Leptolyngbya ectocarpi]MBE9067689.1 CHAT domain-containing protein [Leptolyngbya cf. ectocarpi LEGE 11479]